MKNVNENLEHGGIAVNKGNPYSQHRSTVRSILLLVFFPWLIEVNIRRAFTASALPLHYQALRSLRMIRVLVLNEEHTDDESLEPS